MAIAARGEHEARVRSPVPLARLALAYAFACALLSPTLASACPDCPEGVRRQVRAGIFDDTFAQNLAIAALPFGVLSGILAAMALGQRRRHA